MPLLPLIVLTSLAGILAVMFVFILGRRAWRTHSFRRRDQFREYWLRRLPELLAGEIPGWQELQDPRARQTLESLLVSRLQDPGYEHRKRLVELIQRTGLEQHHVQSLRRGSRWKQLYAASLLGQIRSRAAIPALLEVLEARWPPLRAAALRSLGMIASPTAAPAILRCLERGRPVEPNIWLDAAVACVPDPEAFLPLLEDDRAPVRALAARALAEFPHPVPFELLNPLVFDPDPEIRAQVVRALGKNRDHRATPLLIAATSDEAWFVRLRALAALADLGAPPALDAVLHATGDRDFRVRQRAASTLASLTSRPAEVLETLLNRNDRYAVEGFLSQLARAGLLWRTLPLLRATQERVRLATEKLLTLAIAAGYYQTALSAVETDSDWRVRMATARLLARADNPALLADLEQRLAAAPTPRLRRLWRAILRSAPALAGEKDRDPLARPA